MTLSCRLRLRLVLGLLLLKLGYFGLLCGALLLWNDFDVDKFQTMMARWPRSGPPLFAGRFATWDSAHYLYLSEVGYRHGARSCAFYPLWPLLVRWCSPLFGGSHVLTGTILANVISLAAWVLFYQLVARRWGEPAAKWSLVFLIAFPGALFFQFNYTESLFLLLTLALWWALTEQRFGWSWITASLLPLTRGVGAFAVLPIAWYALEPAWPALRARFRRLLGPWAGLPRGITHPGPLAFGRGEGEASPGSGMAQITDCSTSQGGAGVVPLAAASCGAWWGALKAVVGRGRLLCAPVLGWALYLALMWHWTGNPFEGMQAQKYWGVHSISNLWNVPKFVVGLFTPTEWHEFRGSVLDRCVFILLLDCLPVLWRLDKELLVWIYMLGILPAMSGTFTSFTRFASCAFPLFIALGVFLGNRQWRWPRYGLLAVFVVLHLALLWRFVNFRWAGWPSELRRARRLRSTGEDSPTLKAEPLSYCRISLARRCTRNPTEQVVGFTCA